MKIMGWLFLGFACMTTASAETFITVYNDNRAVVRQTDVMTFAAGRQTLSYSNIPGQIDPSTVRFIAEDNVTVLEQKYRYDLTSSVDILRFFLEKKITLRLKDDRLVEGVLLSITDNVILRGADNGIIIIDSGAIERYDLPVLPENLVVKPTLFWLVDSKPAGNIETEISYITGGLSWRALYNAVISDNSKLMDISSWVSLDNNSGMSYNDAALKLVAGTLNRAKQQPQPFMARSMAVSVAEDMAGYGFEERSISEYHLYELGRSVSLANGETTQIPLFNPVSVNASKKYNYDSRRNAEQVAVVMEFTNSEKAGLGVALPGGTVRLYQRDTDGSLELVGEDTIVHTARDEDVKFSMGYAFDLAAERRVSDTSRITPRIQEITVEINLRNRSKENVEITATEYLYGDWEILQSSHRFTKKDATTVEFPVPVPAGGETIISYTARIQ